MRVGVVGLGGIGTLFYGGLMKAAMQTENEIIGVVRASHIQSLKKNGISIDGESIKSGKFDTLANGTSANQLDVLLLSVKSIHTKQVAEEICKSNLLKKNGIIITLQNGLKNTDVLEDVLGHASFCIIQGVTYNGGFFPAPGRVVSGGKGRTVLAGSIRPDAQKILLQLSSLMNQSGFECKVVDPAEVKSILWSKLVVNAAINPLASIFNAPNRCVLPSPSNLLVVEGIVSETVNVAKALGINLKFEKNPVDEVFQVAEATGSNICSMLSDLRRGQTTEIASINGAIVEYGKAMAVPTPCNEFLVNIINSMSENSVRVQKE